MRPGCGGQAARRHACDSASVGACATDRLQRQSQVDGEAFVCAVWQDAAPVTLCQYFIHLYQAVPGMSPFGGVSFHENICGVDLFVHRIGDFDGACANRGNLRREGNLFPPRLGRVLYRVVQQNAQDAAQIELPHMHMVQYFRVLELELDLLLRGIFHCVGKQAQNGGPLLERRLKVQPFAGGQCFAAQLLVVFPQPFHISQLEISVIGLQYIVEIVLDPFKIVNGFQHHFVGLRQVPCLYLSQLQVIVQVDGKDINKEHRQDIPRLRDNGKPVVQASGKQAGQHDEPQKDYLGKIADEHFYRPGLGLLYKQFHGIAVGPDVAAYQQENQDQQQRGNAGGGFFKYIGAQKDEPVENIGAGHHPHGGQHNGKYHFYRGGQAHLQLVGAKKNDKQVSNPLSWYV